MIRRNYRAKINASIDEIKKAFGNDREAAENLKSGGRVISASVYVHEDMLFLYLETVDETLEPEDIFVNTSKLLKLWPERDKDRAWCYMYPIYWHDVPKDPESWRTAEDAPEKKTRRGRIAYLKHDKLFSYVYFHKAIVEEGLLKGDRFQFIALHEDILFSYFEEPKEFTNIKKSDEESEVIKEWLAVDPESHFDHELSGKENFLLLESIFSI